MLPLTTTDARYAYRCLDATLKQASVLSSALGSAHKPSKTLFSRCLNLASSLHRKASRAGRVVGKHQKFMSLMEVTGLLVDSFHSRTLFPARFGVVSTPPLTALLERVHIVELLGKGLLQELGAQLAKKEAPRAPAPPTEEDGMFEKFFEKAKGRGWRIQEAQRDEQYADADDPFGEGCQLLNNLTAPYQNLLADDVEVGLTSFSIVLLEAYRLPNTVFRECARLTPLHKVLGTYVVLQDVMLMGIHRDLIQIMDGKKSRIDTGRFRYLLPYLRRNIPGADDILNISLPSGPTRFARYHYYTPLLPLSLVKLPDFSLGKWCFLTSRNGEQQRANSEQ